MKYIFTEEQFLALLAVGNIERLYSFKMIDDMEDEALIDAVHSLYGRRWLQEREDRLVPCPALEEMLAVMRSAAWAVKIQLFQPGLSQRLLYPEEAGTAVILERCQTSRELSMKLQRARQEELIFEIMDNELEAYAPALTEEEEGALCLEEMYREGRPVFEAERVRTEDGGTEAVLTVRALPFLCLVRWEWGDTVSLALYSDNYFKELFQQITGGEAA